MKNDNDLQELEHTMAKQTQLMNLRAPKGHGFEPQLPKQPADEDRQLTLRVEHTMAKQTRLMIELACTDLAL